MVTLFECPDQPWPPMYTVRQKTRVVNLSFDPIICHYFEHSVDNSKIIFISILWFVFFIWIDIFWFIPGLSTWLRTNKKTESALATWFILSSSIYFGKSHPQTDLDRGLNIVKYQFSTVTVWNKVLWKNSNAAPRNCLIHLIIT